MNAAQARTEITGVILAGGRGQRLGGQDKGLIAWQGRPLVEHIIERLKPQVATLCINANRNMAAYQAFALSVIPDQLSDFQGPLAGIACTLATVHTPFALIATCDAPLLPNDLAQRLYAACHHESTAIAIAHDGIRPQYLHALIRTNLVADLRDYLTRGERKVAAWYDAHPVSFVDFSNSASAFHNVNTPNDLVVLPS
ncbi:molybdenum cofactor guanylyltransferase MobA [Thiolinea disciformis]|uniref:molybdenum cofactor guanylyltransferase MobA n=1 Tax=Thiolinea disciformis TaxID=125614 RepID=UPI0003699B2C|nr:molybdenum cofactor guanylyltransferase MobA [Thiolinea disciformis]